MGYSSDELCPCERGDIVLELEYPDGLPRCLQCRAELGMQEWCLADIYEQRAAERAAALYAAQTEIEESEAWLENFNASHGSCERQPFRQPQYKHSGNRRREVD